MTMKIWAAGITLAVATTAIRAQVAVNTNGQTVKDRFAVAPGYTRMTMPANSFGAYVQQLPLLPHSAVVHYYNGGEKPNHNIYTAVVNMPIGNKDLQQCADAIMHVRADYLYKTGQSDKIKFTFTSGFVAEYSKWQQGYRTSVSGNKVTWVKKGPAANNYAILQEYMDVVYMYCGTLSMSKELKRIPFKDIRPGDVLIKGGSPGHAELILDVAQDKHGNKIFMLAQSYMPAQQMQVLVNRNNPAISPWYEAKGQEVSTPEWDFTADQVMRFAE